METTEETPTGLDIAAASEQIGNDLFPSQDPPSPETGQDSAAAVDPPQSAAPASTPEQPTLRSVPKSWAKDYHPYWEKIDPKAQEYIEKREKDFLDGLEQYKGDAGWAKTVRESLSPNRQTLQQLKVDEVQAIKSLFNADHQLRYSPTEQRIQYFKKLAENYGVDLSAFGKAEVPNGTTPAQVDPVVQELKQQVTQMQSYQQAQLQAAQQEARTQAEKEIAAFAADEKAHPYFNDVSSEMTMLIQADRSLSLQDAYDRAVRLNPVTYAKEVARIQTEHEAKLKENARLESLPKKKASAVNIKSRDTQRSPTEPSGANLEDALKQNLAAIKARVS